MKVRIIPGTQLFPWMLRHSVWTVVRYQSDQTTKQTPYEGTRGCRYESALVPFGEVVMAKIADADKMRAGKLDSAWVEVVWVGRVNRSNEHLLLTTKGCISDTLKGSAEMLTNATVRPGELPRPSRGRPRKDGFPAQARTTTTSGHEETCDDLMPGSSDDHLRQPATETDVIEQSIVMDSGTARASDDRADQGVLRMDREEGISAEEQARRRLRSKQPARRSLTDDETVAERPDLEQAHKFYSSIRTLRSPESIHASRMVEINKWRERGVVERWIRQAAMATGGTNVQCTLGG